MHYEKVGDSEPVCIEDELPFELPDGWCWARIRNATRIGTGATPLKSNPRYYKNGNVPWITSASACRNHITKPDGFITEAALEETNCTLFPAGCLIVAMYGEGKTRGSVAFLDIEATTNQACAVIQPIGKEPLVLSFIKVCYEYSYDSLRTKSRGGNQPNLNLSAISDFLIPIPPLAEQQRIVAALDDLLARIDTIEREQAELDELLAKTRSKVLDLAICGKLVPQDPADEPASVLLERIHAEKLQMVADGKLKKKDVAGDSVIYRGDDNSYYERHGSDNATLLEGELYPIPTSWSWTRLGSISNYGDSSSASSNEIADDDWVLDLEDIEKDTGTIIRRVSKAERDSSSSKRSFVSGQLLYSKLRPYLNKVLIAPDNGYCTSEILPISLYGGCIPEFVMTYLRSPYFLQYANHCSYGVKMPRLGTNDGRKAFVALPPVAEQRRISHAVNSIQNALMATR